jgi:hypothetical protein
LTVVTGRRVANHHFTIEERVGRRLIAIGN